MEFIYHFTKAMCERLSSSRTHKKSFQNVYFSFGYILYNRSSTLETNHHNVELKTAFGIYLDRKQRKLRFFP